jgi:CheY-like chemotaxis protein
MRPKILICDDGAVVRMLVRASLARGGYDVIEAHDGDEAVDLADAERPELIVLDMMMPGRTGLEVLAHVRTDAVLSRTPVIMLSARTQAGDRTAAKEAGATLFLSKPFSPAELAAHVEEILAVSN